MEQEKLYVIEEKTYEAHIDEEVHLYGLAFRSFLAIYCPKWIGKIRYSIVPFNDEHTDYLSTGSCTHINNYRRIFLVFQQIWYYVNSSLVSLLSLCYYELIKS